MTEAPPPGSRPLTVRAGAGVVLPFIVCTAIWSSTWLVIRYQLGVVPPAWSIAYRFLIACAAITAYARWKATPLRFSVRQHALAAAYGIFQYAGNYFGVYFAERTVTSGLVALIFALLLVPNALLARIFLRQGVSRAFLTGSGVAIAGLALLIANELAAVPSAHRDMIWIGIGWTLAGLLSASIANVMQASRDARAIPVGALVAWGMAWGSGFDCAVALLVDGPPVIDPHPSYWFGTLYLALFGSALAFSCYFVVIRAIGPGRAAYSGVLCPVLAMLLSTLFEDYRWTPQAAVGGLLTMLGLVVALRARQSARPAT